MQDTGVSFAGSDDGILPGSGPEPLGTAGDGSARSFGADILSDTGGEDNDDSDATQGYSSPQPETDASVNVAVTESEGGQGATSDGDGAAVPLHLQRDDSTESADAGAAVMAGHEMSDVRAGPRSSTPDSEGNVNISNDDARELASYSQGFGTEKASGFDVRAKKHMIENSRDVGAVASLSAGVVDLIDSDDNNDDTNTDNNNNNNNVKDGCGDSDNSFVSESIFDDTSNVANVSSSGKIQQDPSAAQQHSQPHLMNGVDSTIVIDDDDDDICEIVESNPQPKTGSTTAAAEASYRARLGDMPRWMGEANNRSRSSSYNVLGRLPPRPALANGFQSQTVDPNIVSSIEQMSQSQPACQATEVPTAAIPVASASIPAANPLQQSHTNYCTEPIYVTQPTGFVPSWPHMVSHEPIVMPRNDGHRRSYKLSLLSVSDFTVTAVSGYLDTAPPSLKGMRIHIKKIAREQGVKAVFEKDAAGDGDGECRREGRWRIPLAAYQAFLTFLSSDGRNSVEGIPEEQLKAASLGRERLDKTYPSVAKLISNGVPRGLANALAPYQRGGVDFVLERNGRALIADEMGLGKTVQAIASMAIWGDEWPVLVLSPSSARYHWEAEFLHWLGKDSVVNRQNNGGSVNGARKKRPSSSLLGKKGSGKKLRDSDDFGEGSDGAGKKHRSNDDSPVAASSPVPHDQGETSTEEGSPLAQARPLFQLLHESQVHVLTSSKDQILPSPQTRVVVCSYGLAPNLVAQGGIFPGLFRCVIVDESHMLKNKSTKRTSSLLPVLKAADRCLLLSGTPAFARPMELWPQLSAVGSCGGGWWQNESEFVHKYGKGANSNNLAELHTLLMSTVMIRRTKADMLKSIPQKIREQARVTVGNAEMKAEFKRCMAILAQSKGVLGEISRQQPNQSKGDNNEQGTTITLDAVRGIINREMQEHYRTGMELIQRTLLTKHRNLNEDEMEQRMQRLEDTLTNKLEAFRKRRLENLTNGNGRFNGMRVTEGTSFLERSGSSSVACGAILAEDQHTTPQDVAIREGQPSRKATLNHLYNLTGQAKVPTIVGMLKRWLDDPSKGKLCIFAHHISVLDDIAAGAGLNNDSSSQQRYIRIDGSTNPKVRQRCIQSFQTDPTVRIALLGITAAGVAVTLTASSNIWFAELFWTPAIMIQAEDRCHRIGQQARVRCLYVVGKGTLDELLWKLIEKKFRALGEFVEGKEKMNIVVHRTYDDTDPVVARGAGEKGDESEEETDQKVGAGGDILADMAESDFTIQQDIEVLGMAEQMMLKTNEAEEDEAECISKGSFGDNRSSASSQPLESNVIGSSQTSAICLSDDEDVPSPTDAALSSSTGTKNKTHEYRFHPLQSMPRLKLYRLTFLGPTYGIKIQPFHGRFIILSKHHERDAKFGQHAKPNVGDILVSVNERIIPISTAFTYLQAIMKQQIQTPPVVLVFGEDPDFTAYFHQIRLNTAQKLRQKAEAESSASRTGEGRQGIQQPLLGTTLDTNCRLMSSAATKPAADRDSEVIELLDD